MFANPLALLALSLLALPVVIHMLARLKGRRVLFPTVKYLRATESHRLMLMQIERWPLLVIRLLACGLLIFAISDPALVRETGKTRAVLLLIDSSLSMNTERAKEQARSHAREIVASLGAGDVAAIAQFDSSVNVLCDFTSDRDSLEKGIALYSPDYAKTDFSAALTWANQKLAAQPYHKEVTLITDLQAANVYSSEPIRMSGVDLKIIRIEGSPRINASPCSIASRAAGDGLEVESTALLREGDRTTVTAASFKIARRDREVSAIASDSSAILSARMVEGNLLAGTVTTNKPDEFDADDSRFFVAEMPGEKKILLVQSRLAASDQATFIEKAIQASSQSNISIKQTEKSDSIPESLDALARYSVILSRVDALTGASLAAAREYVQGGGSLILTAGVETDISAAAERLDELAAIPSRALFNRLAETESLGLLPPVMPAGEYAAEDALSIDAQPFASARFRAAYSVQASGSEALLWYSNNQPAAVQVRAGAGQVIILGFGLSDKDSSLARSPAFPLFIEWLISSVSTNERIKQFTIGQAPTAGLLRGLTRLTRLYSASGPMHEELTDLEHALTRPGVYEAEYQSEKSVFALNPPSLESTLDQTTDLELLKLIEINEASDEAIQVEKGTALWRILAIGALIMSLLELAYGMLTISRPLAKVRGLEAGSARL